MLNNKADFDCLLSSQSNIQSSNVTDAKLLSKKLFLLVRMDLSQVVAKKLM